MKKQLYLSDLTTLVTILEVEPFFGYAVFWAGLPRGNIEMNIIHSVEKMF